MFRILADATIVLHLAFIVFALLGGLLVLRRPHVVWLHLPAAAWGAWVEFSGSVCPLTPLENWFREQGGRTVYRSSFIEQHLLPILYPASLSRELQWGLGAIVVLVNVATYSVVLRRRTQHSRNDALPKPDDRLPRALVAWYGLYQAAHVLVNSRGLYLLYSGGTLDFPAPPPPSGWPTETIHMMVIIGWVDLVAALLALLFVRGYLRRARWRMWLGTLTLTISVYAAVIYDYWSIASGAWTRPNLLAYAVVNAGFLPVLLLFCLFCRWGARGVFRDPASHS